MRGEPGVVQTPGRRMRMPGMVEGCCDESVEGSCGNGRGGGVAAAAYLGVVSGALVVDVDIGQRVRPLGPSHIDVQAPCDVVFDVMAEPYLGRQPRSIAAKIRVLERGSDMGLA